MKLSDIMNPDAFLEMAEQGYVSARAHPEDPDLFILNYTHSCQYDRAWNDVTRQCRGLIVRGLNEDAEIIARPWPKFFNYGEHEVDINPTAPARVQEKYDGSLGILYLAPDGMHAIATRGSFESEQALHATALWRDRYEGLSIIPKVWTFLFEIVYPGNRIVVDYGDLDDLVLLDVLSVYSGLPLRKQPRWPGPIAHTLEYANLQEALESDAAENAEGFVVTYPNGMKLKIKHEDYVRLHRIVTGLNEKTVWEHLRAGHPLAELLEPLPDEFRQWAENVADELTTKHAQTLAKANATFEQVKAKMITPALDDPREWRKAFAAEATKTDMAPYLFSLLDEKDISDDIWKNMKPEGSRAPKEIVE